MKKQMSQWRDWGKKKQLLLYFYKQYVYDLTMFSEISSMKKKDLEKYAYQDITDQLPNLFPLSINATDKLSKYNIGTIISYHPQAKEARSKSRLQSYQPITKHERQLKRSKSGKSGKKVTFRNTIFYSDDRKQKMLDQIKISLSKNQKQVNEQGSKNKQKEPSIKNSIQLSTSTTNLSQDIKSSQLFSLSIQQEYRHLADCEDMSQQKNEFKLPCLNIRKKSQIEIYEP